MKISYNWLKKWIDVDLTPQELADTLTMLGLETEGKPRKVGGLYNDLAGVVVGHVLEVKPHPNADRLRLTRVDVGADSPLSIVCGAPNVATGQKVAVATVGSELMPIGAEKPLKIKKGKIRGEVSLGMICAEDELGTGTGHDGILVLEEGLTPGTPVREVLASDEDWVIEIDLTPNRIDAASHYGVARDLAAHLDVALRAPASTLPEDKLSGPNPISVRIEADDVCKRFVSMHIEGIQVAESPEWLKSALLKLGLRPRNNVVDITNYVLHDLGQPLHAYDADHLRKNEIVVRRLEKNESYRTLDGEMRQLRANADLLVCDGVGPRCIAGVMGGEVGSVTETTQNILLEAAWFDPGRVRKTARRLGISSDSSYRFERGADPHMAPIALRRAASLILEIAGGTPSNLSDVCLDDFSPYTVELSLRHTQMLVGEELPRETIVRILDRLEIEIAKVQEKADDCVFSLRVPPYRVDVTRPQDVIEEILRIYGYNEIAPSPSIKQSLVFEQTQRERELYERVANALAAAGYREILNNSLIADTWAREDSVKLVNPLSEELNVLRPSLLPGILETIRYNQNRQQDSLRLFEFGKTYHQREGNYQEKRWLSVAVTGPTHTTHWNVESRNASLFTLRQVAEQLQEWLGFRGEALELSADSELTYGLDLNWNDKRVLRYGRVNDDLATQFDLRNEVFYLCADWKTLIEAYYAQKIRFEPIPAFPAIHRDVSMILDDTQKFDEVRRVVQKANPKLIRAISLQDVYHGEHIPEGKKSYLVSVELRDDKKTLHDKAADATMKRVRAGLVRELKAELR